MDRSLAGSRARVALSEPATCRPHDFGIGSLFWAMHEAVIVADAASGRILLWNPASEAIFGYTAAEALQLRVEALIPPRLRAQHLAGLARYAALGRGSHVGANEMLELPAIAKGGKEILIELSLSPVEASAQQGRYVLAVIRNATQRKQLETEQNRLLLIKQSAQAESEAWAEISRQISTSLDLQQVLQTIVVSAHRLVRADLTYIALPDVQRALRVAAVAGNHSQSILSLTIPAGVGIGGRVMASGRPYQTADYPANTEIIHDSLIDRAVADEGIVSCLALPICYGDEPAGVLWVTSRSERRFAAGEVALLERLASQAAIALGNAQAYRREQAARAELAARTQALEAKTAEQDAFLYTVSHDLKAPLVSIQGMAEILEQEAGPHLQDEERFYLRRINENARRLAAMLEDLLLLSRAGRIDSECVSVELATVIERVRESLAVQIARRDACIEIEQSATLWGNPTRIGEIFGNLIDNAIKYTPPERRPLIRAGACAGDDGVECWVADNGVGIAAEQRETVFGIFQRLADGKRLHAGGTGVGLAIVARIVQARGGRIWIEANDGANDEGGCVIRFRLPHPETSQPAGDGGLPALIA